MKDLHKKLLGASFLSIGTVILLTPFTPGSILFLIGLDMIFGEHWPWWHRTKTRIVRNLKAYFD